MSRAKEIIHHDISIPRFKSIIKNFKEVRYIIDKNDKLYAACADEYIHEDIVTFEESKICGYAAFRDDKITHKPWYAVKSDNDTSYRCSHPMFAKFTEKGISRTRKVYDFIW